MVIRNKLNWILLLTLINGALSAFHRHAGVAFAEPCFESLNDLQISDGLLKLQSNIRVLYIAAHPDDENTALLTYLNKARHVRAAYLSLTRGEGGQNLIGDEQGTLLGIIRTSELLQARRIDGAEQYFSRAVDFGFSKSPEEVFRFWNKEEILEDVVRVIREFKPQLIVTRFPITGEGGHGQHTASAILAEEAFDAAADGARFPNAGKLWKTSRLLWNNFLAQRDKNYDTSGLFKVDISKYLPSLGRSVGEISAESRSQHRSQGFGTVPTIGPIYEYFASRKGSMPKSDLLEGIGESLESMAGGKNFLGQIKVAEEKLRSASRKEAYSALVKAKAYLAEIEDDSLRKEKEPLLDKLILSMAGLYVTALSAQPTVSSDDEVKIGIQINHRTDLPLSLESEHFPFMFSEIRRSKLNASENFEILLHIPKDTLASVLLPDSAEKAAINGRLNFQAGSVPIELSCDVQYRRLDPRLGERFRSVEILPEITVKTPSRMIMTVGGEKKEFSIFVRAEKANVSGSFKLVSSPAWKIEPVELSYQFENAGDIREFRVSAEMQTKGSSGTVEFRSKDGDRNLYERFDIVYDHIPEKIFLEKARVELRDVDLKIDGKRLGYIRGAEDLVPEMLNQVGYDVVILDEKELGIRELESLDAIIVGIRGPNVLPWLKRYVPKLERYMQQGGTLVYQYVKNDNLNKIEWNFAPYPLSISTKRVTDENSKVEFLEAKSSFFLKPNRLSLDDFEDWVQERGLCFADTWDEHYSVPLRFYEGEAGENGSLLIARVGKGKFVYTGISFFRQLPAGVPGAFRMFANILNKESR